MQKNNHGIVLLSNFNNFQISSCEFSNNNFPNPVLLYPAASNLLSNNFYTYALHKFKNSSYGPEKDLRVRISQKKYT